jgi:5-dehydro-2-deoxygluconokinase
VVKVLCFCHPVDDAVTWADQEDTILRLCTACRRNRLEFLLEVIPSKVGPVGEDTTAAVIQRFYDLGVYPDWWKLEPMLTSAAWEATIAAIERNDPNTRGILILGLGESEEKLAQSFAVAAQYPLVKGFAVGRTIFADAAKAWIAGNMTDAETVAQMAESYARLCETWDGARALRD